MSKRLDSVILQELQYAANRAWQRIQNSTLTDFLQDEDLQDIVLRQLTIVDEAAARASEAAKLRYPQVDWRRVVGMQNFVVHEYFRVDIPLIWDAVENRLPPLLAELPAIIGQVLATEQANSSTSV